MLRLMRGIRRHGVPTQIEGGELVCDPIADDEAGSIRPNGWLVQGFNDGASAVVVRPWVVCAAVE